MQLSSTCILSRIIISNISDSITDLNCLKGYLDYLQPDKIAPIPSSFDGFFVYHHVQILCATEYSLCCIAEKLICTISVHFSGPIGMIQHKFCSTKSPTFFL